MPRRSALALAAWLVAALVAVVVVLSALWRRGNQPGTPTAPGGRVRLDLAEADGTPMDLERLLEVASGGVGQDGRDDALLEASTLRVLSLAPLQADDDASCALDLPSVEACLSLSWPTSHGYSALLVDLPGPGRYALAELAARGLHQAQQERATALAQQATGAPSGPGSTGGPADLTGLRQATAAALDACRAATDPLQRAALANDALEAATTAQIALDEASVALGAGSAMIGVTFTTPPPAGQTAAALGPLQGSGRRQLVRIVVEDADSTQEMEAWRACLAELHDAGAAVLVQVCDSQALADLDETAFSQRLEALIAAFPDADAWETGNELAGEWTGPHARQRTLAAARALASNPATAAATRLVTLYYQLGQGSAEGSVMSWAHENLTDEVLDLTDVIGLSVYPQWHPLGSGVRRVLGALKLVSGHKQVAIAELGYGAEDLDDGPWWFGSPDDTAVGRAAVARHLTAAALGDQDTWAAPLWWYYLQDQAQVPTGPGNESTASPVATYLVEAAHPENGM